MITKRRATVEDLYRVPDGGKAELVGGELVLMSPAGGRHGRASLKIAAFLSDYEEQHGGGYAFGDNVGFLVDLPDRQSFSPDAAWWIGEMHGLDFLDGAPIFAVEVRSKEDYGPAGERAIAEKIADYFAAGTLVVWDVDLLGPDVVRVYRADRPEQPDIFRRGAVADAEPAVPGWRMEVDSILK